MTVVVFNPTAFKARYPEFNAVNNALLGEYFTEACIYLDNTDCSIVQDIARRTLYLNMLTAHIAWLNGALSTDGQQKPVGRVSAAGEGTVNVTLEYSAPGSQSWFCQSQYGAAFWQATLVYRSFRYRPRPTRPR